MKMAQEPDGKRCETTGMDQHPEAALPALPRRKNLSRLDLPWISEDVRALRGLRPEIRTRSRLFSGSHVHQLRPGAGDDCYRRGAVVELHLVVDCERHSMGSHIVPSVRPVAHAVCQSAVDLSGSDRGSGAASVRKMATVPWKGASEKDRPVTWKSGASAPRKLGSRCGL